ncbi:MAG: hypothetical protein HYS32_04165 [Candidatus Woesearchaeota archaeon]|nr:MAG: hypothetical protein HYS32_04165 [Candidatus Woesearchaeota archaeon]
MDEKNTEWTCNHLRSEGEYDCQGNDPRIFYCALTGKYCVGTRKDDRLPIGEHFTGKHYDNDDAKVNCPAYNLPVDLATRVREIVINRYKSRLEEVIMEISRELT